MKRNLCLLLICCLSAFGLLSCSNDNDESNQNINAIQCPVGMNCEQKADGTGETWNTPSGRECTTNSECEDGFECLLDTTCYHLNGDKELCVESGMCVPKDPDVECTTDSDCEDGFMCVYTGFCPECPEGALCAPCVVGGFCVRENDDVECRTDEDCAAGFMCVYTGLCDPSSNEPCTVGGFCVPNNEEQKCTSNDDCTDGFHCELNRVCPCDCQGQPDCICPNYYGCWGEGVCVQDDDGECQTDSDCEDGFMCVYTGLCPECPEGALCEPCVVGGFCVPTNEEQKCTTDDECGDGFFCELSYDCPVCSDNNANCVFDPTYCIGEGVCRPKPEGECQVDEDCEEGFMCVYMGLCDPTSTIPCVVGGFCVPTNEEQKCTTDDECGEGFYCEQKLNCMPCICAGEEGCVCPSCFSDGVCRPKSEGECQTDEDCIDGFMCVYTGLCPECPEGALCEPCIVGGFCVPTNNECRTDEDCSDGKHCEFLADCVADPTNQGDCSAAGYCVDNTEPIDPCIQQCGVGCPAPEYWICGENGQLYCNECYMNCFDVQIASDPSICNIPD